MAQVRLNASEAGGPCLSTTCLAPMEALARLARGNYEVWKLGSRIWGQKQKRK